MILPWLLGFRNYLEAPITWALVGLNFILFFMIVGSELKPSNSIYNRQFLQETGVHYREYKGKIGFPSAVELFLEGGQGLRDPDFLNSLAHINFDGDPKSVSKWKKEILEYYGESQSRVSYIFGLKRQAALSFKEPLTWITYQFMHADIFHLLGNMLFLFLFGVAIEMMWGGKALLGIYLASGIAGAGVAIFLDSPSTLPMVGASASISGMIGFYLIVEPKKRIRYFYFFSPFQEFFGEVYLSKWWLVSLCIIGDLVSCLTELWVPESAMLPSSIATTAHLGGVAFGLLLGEGLILYSRFAGGKSSAHSVLG